MNEKNRSSQGPDKEDSRPPGLEIDEMRDPYDGRGVTMLGKDGKSLFDLETGEPLFVLTSEEILEDMEEEMDKKGFVPGKDGNYVKKSPK